MKAMRLIYSVLVLLAFLSQAEAQTYHGKGVPYDSATGFGSMGNNATANAANAPNTAGPGWTYNLTIQQNLSGDLSGVYPGAVMNFNTYSHTGTADDLYAQGGFSSIQQVPASSTGETYDFWGFSSFDNYSGTGKVLQEVGFSANDSFHGVTASHIWGMRAEPIIGSGTADDLVGYYSRVGFTGGSSTFSADFQADVQTGSHATTNYGVLINDQSTSGATTNYNLFSTGNGTNFLGSGVQFGKITDPGTAPGAAKLALRVVTGTNAGSCKIIAYAGTSTTPVTITDNVGSGC